METEALMAEEEEHGRGRKERGRGRNQSGADGSSETDGHLNWLLRKRLSNQQRRRDGPSYNPGVI